ncbi:nucleolar complex-associated protein 3 [Macrolepiota fuliginosa MF-IS2]|uniref:Nucleolar complex-associated protein 3 n=1 Tax=Macrolepiota fuliginosa MF-IS2 TaxID=1400762 RepID=A0A9P5XIP1_9AGAR|nr:nucleolar complex-associated protein 3 [Macrolepiota fuliginosa MF-IS2]
MPAQGKRPARPTKQAPSKKRKVAHNDRPLSKKTNSTTNKGKGKEKAFDRKYIPVPTIDASSGEEDAELSDQDLEVLQGASFLKNLDQKGIARSKKELDRLHQLHKPARVERKHGDLPSLNSSDEEDSETEGPLSGGSNGGDFNGIPSSEDEDDLSAVNSDSDTEMPYEQLPRKRRPSWDNEDDVRIKKIKGLPIKLPDGTIQKSAKVLVMSDSEQSSDEESADEPRPRGPEARVEDVATGARFGRAAVMDIIGKPSRRDRVEAAKEQIASICQEILAEPENSLGLLRRLHTFSLRDISTPTQPKPITNDPIIRRLTFLSQLAVFKDVLPGYRIRPLTDKEKAEKVSSMVARTREWEQGLVMVYQTYLRSLETEIKERTELAEVALSCMCTLLAEVTHFNFSVNLISCIVARLSRKSWDKSSELCISTINKVFREDLTGTPSLEIVRMLNRMIKERKFAIHPNVLSCLLHLRLRTELGVRASDTKVEKEVQNDQDQRRRKGKKSDQSYLSKKARKALKDKKEIEKEMREAEAEIDKEERAATQTETLKLLFALYFRVLKNPRPSPLLPAALTGIAKFAHLVNINFFQDLMKVLKDLISLDTEDISDAEEAVEPVKDLKYTRHRLQCITTAFDLLSGQGEALNIDLSDFITQLYGMILPLTLMNDIESTAQASLINGSTAHMASAHSTNSNSKPQKNNSTTPSASAPSQPTVAPSSPISDLLFRALQTVFSPRTGGGTSTPPWRSAAFAKRLLTAALHWPPKSALRGLEFVRDLIAKHPKLEALLSTEDRIFDGIYRPEVDDPQLCNPYGTAFWELQTLAVSHMDPRVRAAAKSLLSYSSGAS